MSATLPAIAVHLRTADRERVLAHFLQLNAADRRLRFGAARSDDSIVDYVNRMDFAGDDVFAVSDDERRLIGVVHVAYGHADAELGLSVLEGARDMGVGNALFARATIHLRNRGVRAVVINCLGENAAMMHLAQKHGMQMQSDGADREARLTLPPGTAQTIMLEWMQNQQAGYVDNLRENARLTHSLLAAAGKPSRFGSA